MSENKNQNQQSSSDPLAKLWGAQQPTQPDPELLRKLWRKNRLKQWLWFLSDVIGGLVAIAICIWFLMGDYILIKKIWVAFFMVFGLIVTPWIIKLRYRSLSFKVSTAEYLERLTEQKHNNIRIAKAAIHASIGVFFFFVFWNIWYYFGHDHAPGEYGRGLLRGAAFLVVVGGGLTLWAKREIRKNTEELKVLE